MKLKVREKLMNKSQYFKNKIYYIIDFKNIREIEEFYDIFILDYVYNFTCTQFMGSYYFENKKDTETVANYVDGLIVMEKLLK